MGTATCTLFERTGIIIVRQEPESGDLLDRVFLKHKFKMTGDCCVLKFLRLKVASQSIHEHSRYRVRVRTGNLVNLS